MRDGEEDEDENKGHDKFLINIIGKREDEQAKERKGRGK